MAKHMGFKTRGYPYFDAGTKMVDTAAMMQSFEDLQAGDLLLLHGCCHNPTGANLDMETWRAITDLVIEKGVIPFVDIAYQGFGDGLDEDAAALRYMASKVPEMCIAASCSKNFGLYAERVGAAIIVCKQKDFVPNVKRRLGNIALNSYAMPPNHGAAIVEKILTEPFLNCLWVDELGHMRERIKSNRLALYSALKDLGYIGDIEFILSHKGMFSSFGWCESFINIMRESHGIYIVQGGRVNFAAIAKNDIIRIASSICAAQNLLHRVLSPV